MARRKTDRAKESRGDADCFPALPEKAAGLHSGQPQKERMKKVFYRFIEWLRRFMAGRNGWDFLNVVLSIVYFIVWAVNLFVRHWSMHLVLWALLALMICRCLSRNTYARRRESQWVEMQYHRIRSFFTEHRPAGAGKQPKQPKPPRDRDHIFRTCPACRAKLRLPKKRGKHTVCCPRCGTRFSVFVLFR